MAEQFFPVEDIVKRDLDGVDYLNKFLGLSHQSLGIFRGGWVIDASELTEKLLEELITGKVNTSL